MSNTHTSLEEGNVLAIDFGKLRAIFETIGTTNVIPVAVQDAVTQKVLIVAYMNEAALLQTLRTHVATFWSTSKNKLWVKGATSGDTLAVVAVYVNCEQNSLLILVTPQGNGACHTPGADGKSRPSCYYRELVLEGDVMTLRPAS